MRLAVFAILSLCLAGCATEPVVSSNQPIDAQYAPASAAALAFDPPVLAGQPMLDLSRDGRQPSAFVGFEDTITTFYDISIEDTQATGYGSLGHGGYISGDHYDRTVTSDQTGSISR